MLRSVIPRWLVTLLILLGPSTGAAPLAVGFDSPWSPQVPAAGRQQQLLAAGARLVPLEVRADLFVTPGGARTVDQLVADLRAGGAEPLLFLLPDPADPTPAAWATFVHDLVERYDADGLTDAPGSPRVDRYAFGRAPDAGPRPLPSERLAQLLDAGRRAAARADATALIGLELTRPETLVQLLDDPTHPAADNLDFLAWPSAGGPGSDAALFLDGGLRPLTLAMDDARRHKWLAVEMIASAVRLTGAPAPEIVRAVRPKAIVLAAALELNGIVQELDAADPAWWALRSLDRLLGDALSGDRLRSLEELSVGPAARAYRFRLDGDELVVAWAFDPDGRADRQVTVRLPLRRDEVAWRYDWTYARTGRPEARVVGGRDGALVTVGIDPVYHLTGPPRLIAPEPDPPAPAQPPDPARDGDADTAWRTVGAACWTTDPPRGAVGAVRLRTGLARGGRASVEFERDGLWQSVGPPLPLDTLEWRTIPCPAPLTADRWRVVFQVAADQPAVLYELVWLTPEGQVSR